MSSRNPTPHPNPAHELSSPVHFVLVAVVAMIVALGSPAAAGEVVISRQSPDYWMGNGRVLLKSTARNSQGNGNPRQITVERRPTYSAICGSTFVVQGSGTYTMGAVTFLSAATRTLPPGATLQVAVYLNTGYSSSGDTAIERNEVIHQETFDMGGRSVLIGEYVSFNFSTPLTGLQRGREYAFMMHWSTIDQDHLLRFWRSHNNDVRPGGELWEPNLGNIEPWPGRDPSIVTAKDPVIYVTDTAVSVPGNAIPRGTMTAWGSHLKYGPTADDYFSTPIQTTARTYWNTYKIIDRDYLATQTVESQVEYAPGTQVAKVRVPAAYDPARPIGLFIDAHHSNSPHMPSSYFGVLDNLYMIGASPEQTSNSRHDPWRLARVLDLAVSLKDEYNIDPDRVYVGGTSGGALIAIMNTWLWPDVFKGAVPTAHAFPLTGTRYGAVWPREQQLEIAARCQRFGFLAGASDGSLWWFNYSYNQWRAVPFAMDNYVIPGIGHAPAPPADLEATLRYVDGPVQARQATNYTDWAAEYFRRIQGTFPDSGPADNPDGDPFTNLEEYQNGTDPLCSNPFAPPPDIVVECTASTHPDTTGYPTNCNGAPVYSDNTTVMACGELLIERHWQCGANGGTQTIQVVDTTPPVLQCAADITISCGDSTNIADTGIALATDACTTATVEFADLVFPPPSCIMNYKIWRSWTARDACGNTTTCTQRIFVRDSTPPVVTCPPDMVLPCDAYAWPSQTGYPTATDDCFDEVYRQNMDHSDTRYPGACGTEAHIVRVWTVRDNCGNAALCTQQIDLVDTQPPVFYGPSDTVIECDVPTNMMYTGWLSVDDFPCRSPLSAYISDTVITASCPSETVITRRFVVTDDCGNTAVHTQRIEVIDSTPPTLLCPSSRSVACGDSTNVLDTGAAMASDNCGTAVVTFADFVFAGGGCPVVERIEREWTAVDACGNSAVCTQHLAVIDSDPPTFDPPPDRMLECGEPIDPGATGAPSNLVDVCGSATSGFHDVVSPGCPQTIRRVWTMVDDCGNTAVHTQVIAVIDSTPPTFDPPRDVVLECGEPIDPGATGAPSNLVDVCGSATSGFHDVVSPGCTQTIRRVWTMVDDCGNTAVHTQVIAVIDSTPPTFDPSRDVVVECGEPIDPGATGAPSNLVDACGSATSRFMDVRHSDWIARAWTVEDECGNAVVLTQTITIVDTRPPAFDVPPDAMVECGEATDPATVGEPTNVDDACGGVTSRFQDVFTGDCGDAGTIARTWTIEDDAGNTTTGVQIIAVVDTRAPDFDVPPNLEINVGDPTDPAYTGTASNFIDACGFDGSDYVEVFTPFSGQAGVLTRTWRAWDRCGNTNASDQLIHIVSTNGPFFDLPPDRTVECGGSTNVTDTGGLLNVHADCEIVGTNMIDTVVPGACGGTMVIHRHWTVHDGCGNTNTKVQTITVTDSTAPGFDPPPDRTVECDAPTDPAATGAPSNLVDVCGTASGRFADVVSPGCAGTILRTWTVEDECGNAATHTQTITVTDSTAPGFDPPPDRTVECGAPTDPVATGAPSNLVDGCGTASSRFADVVSPGCAGTILRTWTVEDECGNAATHTQAITVIDSTAPGFDPPPDRTVECGAPTDPAATGAPSNLVDVCGTASSRFADVVSPGCAGTILRTWTVEDECGNAATHTQAITVIDSTAPGFDPPPDRTVKCGAPTDPAATGAPSNLVDVCGTASSRFADVVSPGCAGTILRTWTVEDECGNAATHTQTVTVIDSTAPGFDPPPDRTVECGAPTDPAATGAPSNLVDVCGTASSRFADVVSPGCAGTILRTWTVEDECGNAATHTQTVTVIDSTAPGFDPPPDRTVECGAPTDPAATGAPSNLVDVCGTASSRFADVVSPGCAGTILRTWTVEDECGNAATHTQTVTVIDSTAPGFDPPPDRTVECGAPTDPAATGAPSNLVDGCGTASGRFADVVSPGCAGTILRTWTVEDECGNAATHTQTVTVIDSTAPGFDPPPDRTVECGAPTDPAATGAPSNLVDGCGTASGRFADVVSPGCAGTILRTWTVEDECGNAATHTQTVTVTDSTAPGFDPPPDRTVECGAPTDPAATGAPSNLVDGCNSTSNRFTDTIHGDAIVRVWEIADSCGNARFHTQTIAIIDTTAPTFVAPAEVTISQGDSMDPRDTGEPTGLNDACGPVSIDFVDAFTTNAFGLVVEVLRSWRAWDGAGNTNVQNQVIHIDPLPPNLRLTATSDPPRLTFSSDFIVTITLTNAGPGVAFAVTLTNDLPVGLATARVVAAPSECFLAGGRLTCHIDRLAAGASVRMQLDLTADGASSAPLTNTATATASSRDTDPSDNTVTITVLQSDFDRDDQPDWRDPDDDNDRIPDDWETAHALNPTNAADGPRDNDGDGFTNAEEYECDTNPQDSADYLRVTREEVLAGAAGRRLHFPTRATRRYTVQTTTDLRHGPWTDVPALTDLPGIDGVMQAVHPGRSDPARHYRIRAGTPVP